MGVEPSSAAFKNSGNRNMLNWWQRIAAFFLACAVLQLVVATGAAAGPYSAADMLSECHALLATAKATADPDSVELENTFSTGACWGAFLSIQQFAVLRTAGAKEPMLHTCVPENTTLVQLIQVFDAYAREHPELDSEPFTVVALSALHEAFHCGGKTSLSR
jgi:Rap1a immunity proteins